MTLFQCSDHVKVINFHSTEPSLITSLYNRETGAVNKSDNFKLRVFNYNTYERTSRRSKRI